MNYAHLHLVINHAPLFGLVFGFCLLMYFIRKRTEEVARIAMYTFILSAIASLVTYISGDNAQHVIENIKEVNKKVIEEHEKLAKIANLFTIITGSASFSWFFIKNEFTKRYVAIGLTAVCLMGIGFMSKTANIGSQIRHGEISEFLTDKK
jgi:glucan phosphoethanolaminetransferase (alkaline phosphatase superfamily)